MVLYCIREGINVLPPANKLIASKLFSLLNKIIKHQETSKMSRK